MPKNYLLLKQALLLVEFLSAIVGLVYFIKLKKSHWRWFSTYLAFIFAQECFWFFATSLTGATKQIYYTFVGVPVQYLFFFWLYAYKSLGSKRKFLSCSLIYLLSYIPLHTFLTTFNVVYSLNLTIGTILLSYLIVLEFLKQIQNDNILKFKENKMFYITIGTILFYIGTYPFFTFYNELRNEPYLPIWNIYYYYYMISNCIMYLLFTASFIWGKHHS